MNPDIVRRQGGLTLLEVMVALFIFAMTGTAILKAAGDHLGGISVIQQTTFATWVANNRLTELSLSKTWPPENNAKGSEDMAGTTWYWTQSVKKTEDDDLRQVEISVSDSPERDRAITTVSSYIAKGKL